MLFEVAFSLVLQILLLRSLSVKDATCPVFPKKQSTICLKVFFAQVQMKFLF